VVGRRLGLIGLPGRYISRRFAAAALQRATNYNSGAAVKKVVAT